MTELSAKRLFWHGFRDCAPFILVVMPFGLLFGVVATEAGFNLVQTMSMSFLVIAGASQFAAVSLMEENAPVLVILATALAVNMRMAMYSASMVPHMGKAPLWQRALAAYFLVDQTYGVAVRRYESEPKLNLSQRMAFFFGASMAICPLWYAATFIGAVAGSAIPPEYALDFAVPITFIALVAPYLGSLPYIAAAFVSVVVALAFAWIPYNGGLMIAAGVAMLTGAGLEIWLEKRP